MVVWPVRNDSWVLERYDMLVLGLDRLPYCTGGVVWVGWYGLVWWAYCEVGEVRVVPLYDGSGEGLYGMSGEGVQNPRSEEVWNWFWCDT